MTGRSLRATAAAMITGATLLLSAAPALADGTGGVNLTLPGRASAFHLSLAAHEQGTQTFVLTNLTGATKSVELYAAAAVRNAQGSYAVAGVGSAPWIGLAPQVVTLPAHQHRTYTFTVARDRAPWGEGMTYGAVVLQQQSGNVVTRVATLVYLDRLGAPGVPSPAPSVPARVADPLPAPRVVPTVRVGVLGQAAPWLLAVAAALVAGLGVGVGLAARRRRGDAPPKAAPAATPENTPATTPALR